jgi:hypothetical protein
MYSSDRIDNHLLNSNFYIQSWMLL